MADQLDTLVNSIIDKMGPQFQQAVNAICSQRMGSTATGMIPGFIPNSSSTPMLPSGACAGGVPIPSGVQCDQTMWPQLALDMQLYSFPLIEDQLWQDQTNIDRLVSGVFPLVAGATVVLAQDAARTLSYIPGRVSIQFTWVGAPQPGLVSLQFAAASKGSTALGTTFGSVMKGSQFECKEDCITLDFPTYKGCTGFPVGALSEVQLQVSLAATATSSISGIAAIIYHQRSKKSGCGGCNNGSCSL